MRSYNQNRLNNLTKPLTNCLIILQTHGGFHILCYMSEVRLSPTRMNESLFVMLNINGKLLHVYKYTLPRLYNEVKNEFTSW